MNEGEVISKALLEMKQRFQEIMFKEAMKDKVGTLCKDEVVPVLN
jgi:hypothetical protein